jgi:hypothetical protein
MPEEKEKKKIPEVIALPPLKMVLVYAKEERANQAAQKKAEMQDEQVNAQSLIKIIEHLEKKK